MKSTYEIRLSRQMWARADVDKVPDWFLQDYGISDVGPCYMLSRINVPTKFCGRGFGSALLTMVVGDADYEGVRLVLEICPYGRLDADQLQEWYERYGFVQVEDDLFLREPGA